MTALTGFGITNFPSDILYGEGVLFVGATKLGVTKGPPKFTPNRTFAPVEFDGQHARIKGLDRVMHGEPVIAFTMLEIGAAGTGNQIVKVEPGTAVATVTATGLVTYTPQASGAVVASGSYLTDVRVMWERGAANSGNYFAVHFPLGLITKYDLAGQDKKEALIAVEIVGRVDLAAGSTVDAAYTLEYRTTLP